MKLGQRVSFINGFGQKTQGTFFKLVGDGSTCVVSILDDGMGNYMYPIFEKRTVQTSILLKEGE